MKKILLILIVLCFIACGKKEKEVTIYMWGGSTEINNLVDSKIAPYIKEKKGITLKRVPIVNIKDTVNKLIVEKQAGKTKGNIDIIWVNGENFKALKEAKVLEKDILSKVKNRDILKESTTVTDFGEKIDGMEVPLGEAQFNFIYDEKNGDKPFTDYLSMKEFIKSNKGKFTYTNPNTFIGSAFIRNLAIDMLGSENIQKMSDEEFKNSLTKVWDYLNEIKPYLWREGKTYPESEGKMDMLYANKEILLTMGYTINKVNMKISTKEFPESSKSFLLDKGTLFNNHYLAIPSNSQNKNEAIEVIECFISPEIQAMKQDPKNWGDFTVLNLEKLSKEQRDSFNNLRDIDRLPSLKELNEKRVPELSASKVLILEEGWKENVGKN